MMMLIIQELVREIFDSQISCIRLFSSFHEKQKNKNTKSKKIPIKKIKLNFLLLLLFLEEGEVKVSPD